eukprot:1161173-Pelagomonas_calceolata.AAC.6
MSCGLLVGILCYSPRLQPSARQKLLAGLCVHRPSFFFFKGAWPVRDVNCRGGAGHCPPATSCGLGQNRWPGSDGCNHAKMLAELRIKDILEEVELESHFLKKARFFDVWSSSFLSLLLPRNPATLVEREKGWH